jgi:hypothetical protein
MLLFNPKYYETKCQRGDSEPLSHEGGTTEMAASGAVGGSTGAQSIVVSVASRTSATLPPKRCFVRV